MQSDTMSSGIDFHLTEDKNMFRKTARAFAEAEIKPHVMKLDEAQEFPMAIFQKLADLGFLGVTVPSDLEGAGLSALEFVVIMEEIARVDPSV